MLHPATYAAERLGADRRMLPVRDGANDPYAISAVTNAASKENPGVRSLVRCGCAIVVYCSWWVLLQYVETLPEWWLSKQNHRKLT